MKGFLLFAGIIFSVLALNGQAIRLATYQYAENNRIHNIQPLADHLGKNYGYKVQVKSYATVHEFIKAIRQNEVDIALINTFGYLLLEAPGTGYPMQPVTALEVKQDARDNYKTAILVSAGSGTKELKDIIKQASAETLALVSPGSTSGNLVPRLALAEAGIPEPEKTFKSVIYTRTHAAAIDALLEGKAQVAAMGFTTYESFRKSDTAGGQQVRTIWLSPEIPLGPVLFNKRFSSVVGNELLQAFLGLKDKDPAALEAIKAGWSEARQSTHFIPINRSYYDSFKKNLGRDKDLERILQQFLE
ncbi:MAG TPA: phosphate/phosphite/phosphonate ABC transporter substrate-binding protein [Chitinophagaceae bacterium]|nr:phosphate/phosphite/phosphonate ABC transporter substrate-binding protein [Chitinophagaceae bacterium]HEX5652688.1 phosphate/phosphite/phosphonate ABC transporter substrate-binding protein [Chitinophagaceae bacterium]